MWAGSPVQKLRRIRVDPVALSAVVVTHTHPDHVYGLPALLQCLLILGRRAPLPIYCRVEHVDLVGRLLDLFGLRDDGLPVLVVPVEPREGVRVLETPDLVVTTSPNAHGRMPNLAVRVDAAGRSVVYSSDTRPCAEVETLARGATALIHEATFCRPDPDPMAFHGARGRRVAGRPGWAACTWPTSATLCTAGSRATWRRRARLRRGGGDGGGTPLVSGLGLLGRLGLTGRLRRRSASEPARARRAPVDAGAARLAALAGRLGVGFLVAAACVVLTLDRRAGADVALALVHEPGLA